MAFHSSPPLIPDDTAELPSTRSLGPDTHLPEPYFKNLPSHFDSDANVPSSDPIFSDSPSEADVADYQSPERQKRKRRGPWWEHDKKQKQRKMRGQSSLRKALAKGKGVGGPVDSGVWMGSDASEESLDSVIGSGERMKALRVRESSVEEDQDQEMEQEEEWNGFSDDEPPTSQATVSGDDAAFDIVQSCVDAGKEVVDLSDLALTELSNDTLRPLHQLIRHPHISLTEPPSEEEFTTLTPSIQLYLAGNWLRSLPSELFGLENLNVLSLRNNSLEEIPRGIDKLRKLKELNIAQNNVSVLPWEMLELVGRRTTSKRITLRPNPFLQPSYFDHGLSTGALADLTSRLNPRLKRILVNDSPKYRPADAEEQDWQRLQDIAEAFSVDPRWVELSLRFKEAELMKWQQIEQRSWCREAFMIARQQTPTGSLVNTTLYLASSAIQYFNPDGSAYRPSNASQSPAAPSLEPILTPTQTTAPQPPSTHSNAPSLFSLSLAHLQANRDLSVLPADLPTPITTALEKAHASNVSGFGNEKCSSCWRRFVIPRAEWVEYWAVNAVPKAPLKASDVLPFRRRVCRWGCARVGWVGDHVY
ncbi:hypothetical protein MBLNU230_g8555t1 [Neophaeotheca triangularis]